MVNGWTEWREWRWQYELTDPGTHKNGCLCRSIWKKFAGIYNFWIVFHALFCIHKAGVNSRTSNDLNFQFRHVTWRSWSPLLFWAGGLAGVVSAAATHQLDVAKTSLDSPEISWRETWIGPCGKVMERWWYSWWLGGWWWFQIFYMFIPTWGRISNLTDILQMGWNHQLDDNYSWWHGGINFFPPTWVSPLILPYRMTTICCSNVPESIQIHGSFELTLKETQLELGSKRFCLFVFATLTH